MRVKKVFTRTVGVKKVCKETRVAGDTLDEPERHWSLLQI